MDVVLLHNPSSGDGDQSSANLANLLRKHGYQPECFSLNEALQRTDLLKRGEFIVVAGGDGSIKRLANQIVHQKRPVAPLPLGTANNIATSLGITGEIEDIIAGWRPSERRRPIDLGLARGPWGERHFIEAVGIGLIGRAIKILDAIDEASQRKFSQKEDKLYRDLCVLLTLAREMPPLKIDVVKDGENRSGDYLLLEVMNISRTGPGYELARDANPSDGRLSLVAVRAKERDRLQKSLTDCLHQLDRGTTLWEEPVKRLQLELAEGEVRLDDEIIWPPESHANTEIAPDQPITIDLTVVPGVLEFITPTT
jgi:diacylglycerol kinase (ATP)